MAPWYSSLSKIIINNLKPIRFRLQTIMRRLLTLLIVLKITKQIYYFHSIMITRLVVLGCEEYKFCITT